jgi:hypothetical protein
LCKKNNRQEALEYEHPSGVQVFGNTSRVRPEKAFSSFFFNHKKDVVLCLRQISRGVKKKT